MGFHFAWWSLCMVLTCCLPGSGINVSVSGLGLGAAKQLKWWHQRLVSNCQVGYSHALRTTMRGLQHDGAEEKGRWSYLRRSWGLLWFSCWWWGWELWVWHRSNRKCDRVWRKNRWKQAAQKLDSDELPTWPTLFGSWSCQARFCLISLHWQSCFPWYCQVQAFYRGLQWDTCSMGGSMDFKVLHDGFALCAEAISWWLLPHGASKNTFVFKQCYSHKLNKSNQAVNI